MFNRITETNESKTLLKDVSCKCKYRFNGRKCNSDKWWNNNKCWCECKKRHVCEKDYVWNPATWNCENGKYLASVMDDSMISCNEIINVMETNFMKKIKLAKHRILIFSYIPIFLFLLINIAL